MSEPFQCLHESGVIRVALLLRRLNRSEDLADCIHDAQEGSGDLGVEDQFAGPDAAEKVFAGVGNCLELWKAEEPGRSLDRVKSAEDTRERFPFPWFLFKGDEIEIELSEVFVGFQQKLADNLVHQLPFQVNSCKALTPHVSAKCGDSLFFSVQLFSPAWSMCSSMSPSLPAFSSNSKSYNRFNSGNYAFVERIGDKVSTWLPV